MTMIECREQGEDMSIHSGSTKLKRSGMKWRLIQLLSSVRTNQGTANVSKVLLSSLAVKISRHDVAKHLFYHFNVHCVYCWDRGVFSVAS